MFSSENNFRCHVTENHSIGPKKRYKCDQCNKEYKRKRYLTHHKKDIHNGRPPISCKICGNVLSTKASFYWHIYKVHKTNTSEYDQK